MKRNWSLVRRILFCVESQASRSAHHADGWGDREASEHSRLVIEAGWVLPFPDSQARRGYWCDDVNDVGARLTADGVDLLDLLRDESSWDAVRSAEWKIGGLPTSIVRAIAEKRLRELTDTVTKGQG